MERETSHQHPLNWRISRNSRDLRSAGKVLPLEVASKGEQTPLEKNRECSRCKFPTGRVRDFRGRGGSGDGTAGSPGTERALSGGALQHLVHEKFSSSSCSWERSKFLPGSGHALLMTFQDNFQPEYGAASPR